MSTLEEAVQAIRMGNREEGRRMLEEILEVDESNEEVWLWLSSVVDTDEDREICLENVLALNPDNIVAKKGLEALQSGTFNVKDLMAQAIDQDEEEDVRSGATFLEEFRAASLDDELVMPSTMGGQKTKPKRGGLNIRLILLILFAFVIIVALGGVAISNLMSGGDEGQPGQEAPAGGEGAPVEPTATETPTPLPTDTPTPTHTPFELPTPAPTELPTPTATPVVAPTPG